MGVSELLVGLVCAVFLGLIPAAIAKNKGHSFAAWWLFGFLLFIAALPMAIVLRADVEALERSQLDSGNYRRCPFCAEVVRGEAIVCRFCGRDLPALPDTAMSGSRTLVPEDRFQAMPDALGVPLRNSKASRRIIYDFEAVIGKPGACIRNGALRVMSHTDYTRFLDYLNRDPASVYPNSEELRQAFAEMRDLVQRTMADDARQDSA